MRGLITKALRDLLRRPTRSLLTLLGVVIGVAGLVAIVFTARTITRVQRTLVVGISQADIRMWVWDAPSNLVRLLETDPRITEAELRMSYMTRWRSNDLWMDIELLGIDDWQQVRVNRFELLEGRYPKLGEALIDSSTARSEGLAVGQEIAYQDPSGAERYLRISGISRSPGHLSSTITNTALGYVPASFVRRLLGISGSNQLLIRVSHPSEIPAVLQRVSMLLQRQSIQWAAPEIRSAEQFVGKRELDALIVVMFIFSVIGLLLSSLLVVNTLSASVAEQINEIAILKSLGATRAQVLFVYLLEALIYGALGTLLGVLLGTLGGWRIVLWIAALGNVTVRFQLASDAIVLGLLVGIGITLLSGLAPAILGAQVSIKEALESYGIRSDFGQGRIDRLLRRVHGIPPLVAMSVRNLGRRTSRTALTLLAVGLATAAFLSATVTRDSVNAAIDGIYTTYNADAWVWLGDSVNPQTEYVFDTVDGVTAAEGWLVVNGFVQLAEARLWGLPADSTLYREVMREGRWYRADEFDAVVVSEELADAQRIRVGDCIKVQANDQFRCLEVVGIAVDNSIFLGGTLAGKAFMPRAALAQMLGQPDRVSLFALGLATRERGAADRILADVEHKVWRWRPNVQPIYVEIQAAKEASRLLTYGLVAMVFLVALVGALGILNTLTLNVLERRREIAVMRAMGATDAALLVSFLAEGIVLGLLGWGLGLAIGYPSGRIFTAQLSRVLFSLDYVVSLSAVLVSVAFALGLAILASLAPALGAAHTQASAALRYE